jgi:hypothetical protein
MTLDLPFVVSPAKTKTRRIGTKATGILELPVLRSLQVAEVIAVSDLTSENDPAIVTAAKLAQKISAEQSISLSEAYALVEAAALGQELSEAQEAFRIQYLAEIAELTKCWIQRGRDRMLASVTALIRCRLDRPQWSVDDTGRLPQALMEALFAFFEEERQAAEPDSAAPPSEEEIKKQPPGTGDQPALIG